MRSLHVSVSYSLSFVRISLVCNPSPYSRRLHSALALLATAPHAADARKRPSLVVLRPNIADSQ